MHLAAIISLCIPLLAVAQPVIPSSKRFPRDTPAQQVTDCEVLISELDCVACHATGEYQGRRFQSRPVDVKIYTVRVIRLDASGGVVCLTIDEMRPGYEYELHATGVRNFSQGKPLLHSALTTDSTVYRSKPQYF